MADQQTQAVPVTFANGRTAVIVSPAGSPRADDLVAQLGLPPAGAVIVVVGSGDSLGLDVAPRLSELFARGLLPAAEDTRATVIDGGTASGVMALIGQAIAQRDHGTVLVGVAPSAKVGFPGRPPGEDAVSLEPNHSHFVLTEGADWGDETKTMFSLAERLVAGSANPVGVVVGGGDVARSELLEMVRRGWPVVVISGSGGLADELAAWTREPPDRPEDHARALEGEPAPIDPVLTEIITHGAFDMVALASEPALLAGVLRRRLGRDKSLESAWGLHASLDQAARCRQSEFRRMQGAILGLGLVATALAVTQGTLDTHGWLAGHWLRDRVLRYALILIPISLSAAVGASARFRPGNKWVVLRGAAEAVKREIFRYRARSGPYRPGAQDPREVRLAERVGKISSSVMMTDVNLGSVKPYEGPLPPPGSTAEGDDGFSMLSPDQYIGWRLQNQADWYRGRTVKLERTMRKLRWAGIAFGGLGSFLAAVGLGLWIAVTTAVAAAAATYLEYMQLESTMLHYNRASADLETIGRWWTALPDAERLQAQFANRLIEESERVMRSESAGWVQDMHDAMTELRSQQERNDDAEGTARLDAGPATRPRRAPAGERDS